MIDETEFSEIVVTIDTREKRPSRVNRIKKFFESHGGMVVQEALKLCDYRIEGTFRSKAIDLGIEFKEFIDYNSSKDDLHWKLFEAGKLYHDVALFVQENGISLSCKDNGTFVKIMQVPDESANITNYYAYKNQLASFANDGIHVRTFQHEVFFEEDVYALLIFLSKDCHNGLHIKGKDYETQLLNLLCKIDGIGAVKAHKIIEIAPNLERLVELAHYDDVFETVLGPVNGKKLRSFIKNTSRVEYCVGKFHEIFDHPLQSSDKSTILPVSLPIPALIPDNISQSLSSVPNIQNDAKSGNPIVTTARNDKIQEAESLIRDERRTDKTLALAGQRPMTPGNTSNSSHLSELDTTTTPNTTFLTDGDQGRNVPEGVQVLDTPVHSKHNDTTGLNESKLDTAIVEFCYHKPKADSEIMIHFQFLGYNMKDLHKSLIRLSKTKLHKYKENDITMYSFNGIVASPDMDIGV